MLISLVTGVTSVNRCRRASLADLQTLQTFLYAIIYTRHYYLLGSLRPRWFVKRLFFYFPHVLVATDWFLILVWFLSCLLLMKTRQVWNGFVLVSAVIKEQKGSVTSIINYFTLKFAPTQSWSVAPAKQYQLLSFNSFLPSFSLVHNLLRDQQQIPTNNDLLMRISVQQWFCRK